MKGSSHIVEKRISKLPHKPHATSQPSRFSHTPRLSTDSAHNQHSHEQRPIHTSHHDISTGTAKPASVGHVCGQCTLTLTDANVAFPGFCGQSNLNSTRMLMQMFVIHIFIVASALACAALSRQAHSRRILAVHLRDPVADRHRKNLKKYFKHNILCSRARTVRL